MFYTEVDLKGEALEMSLEKFSFADLRKFNFDQKIKSLSIGENVIAYLCEDECDVKNISSRKYMIEVIGPYNSYQLIDDRTSLISNV